jgi:hypothetical protein
MARPGTPRPGHRRSAEKAELKSQITTLDEVGKLIGAGFVPF